MCGLIDARRFMFTCQMRIAFLLHNAYVIGGTVRATLNLAAELSARGHSVQLVSVFRHREQTRLPVPSGVSLSSLVDRREGSADVADPRWRNAGRHFARDDSRALEYTELVEHRIVDWLGQADVEVVVATRTGLNVMLARFGASQYLRIGQEHLTHDLHPQRLRMELRRCYPRLDALVTMTAADAWAHQNGLGLHWPPFLAIPNCVPAPQGPPASGEEKIVITAGRLVSLKRFPMLVDAFAQLSADFPDWKLRIYGEGKERQRIAAHIAERGLTEQVSLMGATADLEQEWARGSIAAVTSTHESFGMTLVEAMRSGLPVVSTDCPHGPQEIITDGADGLLVPRDSVRGVAHALRSLMADREKRRKMSRAALGNSHRFSPEAIAQRYEQLCAELTARRDARPEGASSPLGWLSVCTATGRISAARLLRRVRGATVNATCWPWWW